MPSYDAPVAEHVFDFDDAMAEIGREGVDAHLAVNILAGRESCAPRCSIR
ncbi:hypothetical protein ACWAT4_07910 [Bradyrhizobium manausense]